MQHTQASDLLPRFVEGGLGEAERRGVDEHLGGCEQCRDWVATYRLLSESLGATSRPQVSPGHLSSEELCSFALAPESLAEPARERASRHLEECLECRQEMTLVRAAAAEGREAPILRPTFATRVAGAATLPRLAWAAGLILVVGAITASIVVDRTGTEVASSHELRGATLTGRTTIEASDSIVVDTTRIGSGAELNLKAGDTVAFGDGFSVDSGGALSVVVEMNSSS